MNQRTEEKHDAQACQAEVVLFKGDGFDVIEGANGTQGIRIEKNGSVIVGLASAWWQAMDRDMKWGAGELTGQRPPPLTTGDTPRTDKLSNDMLHADGIPRWAEWDQLEAHARQLESELAEANTKLRKAAVIAELLPSAPSSTGAPGPSAPADHGR